MNMAFNATAFDRTCASAASDQAAAVERAENEGMPAFGAHRDRPPPEGTNGATVIRPGSSAPGGRGSRSRRTPASRV